MTKKATQEQLEELHGALAKELARRIKEGSATAADLSVALNLLNKSGVVSLVTPGTPANILDDAMDAPFDEDAEIERQSAIFSGPAHGRA